MAILIWMLILPHQPILHHLTCGSYLAPSPISSPIMDQAIWSWDALATNFHMLLNWISRFNPPMHSIHVDHDIHTIFSRMMAATHFVLRPPLPLLSLSPGYFPRTKGSGLPTPHFFFFNNTTLHVHMDRSFPPRGTNFALGYLPHDVLGCPSCSLTRLASSSILGPLKRVPLS